MPFKTSMVTKRTIDRIGVAPLWRGFSPCPGLVQLSAYFKIHIGRSRTPFSVFSLSVIIFSYSLLIVFNIHMGLYDLLSCGSLPFFNIKATLVFFQSCGNLWIHNSLFRILSIHSGWLLTTSIITLGGILFGPAALFRFIEAAAVSSSSCVNGAISNCLGIFCRIVSLSVINRSFTISTLFWISISYVFHHNSISDPPNVVIHIVN